MTAPASAALFEALALQRAPRSRRPAPDQRLPEGTLQLVRIAAGEEEATASAQRATGESAHSLREAAIFYIQQVFFAPGSSSYRVLGVDPDAADEKLREHYRWLARWLHPDRNPDQWEVVFAERVNNAWQDLRTSERRARYQPAVEEADEWSTLVAAPPPAHVFEHPEEPAPTKSRRRDLGWVPAAVVAGLGSVAIAVVVLFYSAERAVAPPSTLASAEPSTPLELSTPPPSPAPLPQAAAAPDPTPVTAPVPDAPAATIPAARPPPSPAPATSAVATVSRPPGRVAPAPVAVVPTAPKPRAVAVQPPKPEPVTPVASESSASAKQPRHVTPPKPAPAIAPSAVAASAPPAPAAVEPAVVEPAPAAAPKPSSRDANRLLGQLSRAYEDGDVQGMRALFAPDASGPGGGREAILADYRRVFASSSERSLSVRDVSWFVSGDTFTIVATFEAIVTEGRAGRVRKTRGDLRLDLRREGDHWQIFRMQHGERPG